MDNKDTSQALRIGLHALFLVSLNLFSLISGVIILLFLSRIQHDLLQFGLAFVLNLLLYAIIYKFMAGIQKEVMHIDNVSMLVIMFISSNILFPFVFIPLQYLISGNWMELSAVMRILPFLLITNGLCLLLNYYILTNSRP